MIPPEVKAQRVCVARNQAEFSVLTVAHVVHPRYQVPEFANHNAVLMAFRLSDEEKARISADEDVYISLLTGGGPQQPILVWVGKDEPATVFGVEVE